MQGIRDFPAHGKVIEVKGETVVFNPAGTNYHMHLQQARGTPVEVSDRPVRAIIRAVARKLWTVPSGGLFIAPIFGPPRTIQARVRWLDERQMVVHAGTMIVVELPTAESAYDLGSGAIEVGRMVNVTARPGATFELLASAVEAV